MQLGELQHQIERFERRDVAVVAISVDETTDSTALIERLGLTFEVASDPEQSVIQAFHIQNPDTRDLAIHAAYIVDEDGKVFYRKVGRRRPVSQELIDAIDFHLGTFPRKDEAVKPKRFAPVAYPENDFQALLTISRVEALPETIDQMRYSQVYSLLQRGASSDDGLVAFKALMAASEDATEKALLDTAAWLTRQRFFTGRNEVIAAGRTLNDRLTRVRELEDQLGAAADANARDEILQTLQRARAGLSAIRAEISAAADEWNLRYAKSTLRGYREVAQAEIRRRAAPGQ